MSNAPGAFRPISRWLASAAIGLTLAASSVPSAFAEEIKVGLVMPLTGVLAAYGQPFLDAIEIAVDESNGDGGINGDTIELVVEDGQASNTIVLNALNKVLQSEPVAIMGPGLGTQLLAMLPVTEGEKVPLLAASGTRKITQQGAKYLSRIAPHDALAKENTAKFLVETLGKKKIGIMHVGNEWGYSGRDNISATLKDAFGIEPVSIAAYQVTDKDLTAQLLQMQRDGAEVIAIQGHPVDEALAVRQLNQLGIGIPLVGSASLCIAYLRDLADPKDFNGRYCESPTLIPSFSDDENVKAFVAKYKEKAGFAPDIVSMVYYDGMKMLVEVMRKYGTSREEINNGLRQISYEGLAGTYKSDEEGNMLHDSIVMEFMPDNTIKVLRDTRKP